jgi:hypothetical protein
MPETDEMLETDERIVKILNALSARSVNASRGCFQLISQV